MSQPNKSSDKQKKSPQGPAAKKVVKKQSSSSSGASDSGAEKTGTPAGQGKAKAGAGQVQEDLTSSDYYFNAYAHFGEHEKLLRDQTRTTTFMKAIMDNRAAFAGKTVLDLGCGMGILSLFCAKAGAARVLAVECSDVICHAENIVKLNGLDKIITFIKGKIEEVQLPVEKVDIIVCDWMGYFLLQDSVIDPLVFARDKYLVKDGLIFPDKATLSLAAIEDGAYSERRDEFWESVYGFDMSVVKEMTIVEPVVDTCTVKQVVSDSSPILELNLHTVKVEQLAEINAQFTLRAARTDYVHGLEAHFVVEFPSTSGATRHVINTAPGSRPTHWKQTVFCMGEPMMVYSNDMIVGNITIRRNPKSNRDLAVNLSFGVTNDYGKQSMSRDYRML